MKVPLPKKRSTTTSGADGMEIVIHARCSLWRLLSLGAWLTGWFLGECFAVGAIVTGSNDAGSLVMAGWLFVWTIGGAWAIYAWLWQAFGKERITLTSSTLSVKRDLLGFGGLHEYDLEQVKNLRVSSETTDDRMMQRAYRIPGTGLDSIAFDYGAGTFRFGSALEEAEASEIVAALKATHAFRGPAD